MEEIEEALRAPLAPGQLDLAGDAVSTKSELLRTLYAQALPTMVIDLVALAALLVLFIEVDAPRSLLLPWATGIAMVALARYMLVQRFWVSASDDPMARHWLLAYTVTAIFYGALWGAAGVYFVVPGSDASYVVVIFLLCGLGAGAVVVYAASPLTMFLFAVALFTPFSVRLLSIGDASAHLALVLSLAWAGFAMLMGWRSYVQLYQRIGAQVSAVRLAIDLKCARDDAERKNSAKSEFMARMNHDLRTPLNAILGFTDVMRNKVFGAIDNPKYEAYLDIVHDSGTHLYQMISELLDLARVEAGTLVLHDDEFVDLGKLIRNCDELVRETSHRAGVQLALEVSPALPRYRLDPTRIKQVVVNLVTNAIKYSDAGAVVRVRADRAPDGCAILKVVDHGCGMDSDQIERALLAFEQLDQDADRARQGLGLGLAIAKSLVEAHGGALRVESAPAQGTTITLTLPAERAEPCIEDHVAQGPVFMRGNSWPRADTPELARFASSP